MAVSVYANRFPNRAWHPSDHNYPPGSISGQTINDITVRQRAGGANFDIAIIIKPNVTPCMQWKEPEPARGSLWLLWESSPK